MKKTIAITSLLVSLFVSPLVLAETVNINTADAAALDSLNGIGAKKAEAIIAYRTEHGEFKTLEEIKEVPGIGDKMFDKIKEDISLTEGAATVAGKSTEKNGTTADKADMKDDKADKKVDAAVKTDKVSNKAEIKADKS
ncbi:helix-hairpin-helix domain-containing protein [Thiothrix litoralis]|jgi:competence protein ComEA|uniref:Helix-hairpin-helix domain-containing protein n=1 Tax=Thiothrix litoralis TaxID=2891210 RepID=A0ABX7WUG6_9GAMM|nr:helix-hairpin-helix domain-containing protein [Thiothrix litoralis]QTR44565.1 helix-hairpin-helix domain-containing protein [Thiothrix litoralis]